MKNFLLTIMILFVSCHTKNKNMKISQFQFYTQYHQFYLKDKGNLEGMDSQDFWSEDAFREKLALANRGLGIGTQSYGNIKGEIELLEFPVTKIDYNIYDHIVEGGISIPSGELEIVDCPNMQVELCLKVIPGNYRVRIYSSNLSSVIDDDGDDYYRIEIWPSNELERKVLKQYSPQN